jgi:hypothetical protein
MNIFIKNIFNHYRSFIRNIIFCTFLIILSAGCSKNHPKLPASSYIFKNGDLIVSLALSGKELKTSELLKVTINIRATEDMHIILPEKYAVTEIPETKASSESAAGGQTFSLVSLNDTMPELNRAGVLVQSRTIELAPGLPGTYTIPPMTFEAVTRTGKKISITTPAFSIKVNSVLTGDKKNLEIKPVIPVRPAKNGNAGQIIFMLFVLISIVMLIIIRRWNRADITSNKRAIFLDLLQQLRTSQPEKVIKDLQPLMFDFFYYNYKISKTVTSSDELIALLKNKNINNIELQKIEDLLTNYNLLRFSKNKITAEKCDKICARFAKIIQNEY